MTDNMNQKQQENPQHAIPFFQHSGKLIQLLLFKKDGYQPFSIPLNQKVYKTMIPRNIRLAEAPSYGMPINLYDSKSTGAESYMALADEVIKRKDV